MADSKVSDLSAVTAPALTDLLYVVNSSTDKKISPNALLGLLPIVPGGRLTLTTGTPVATADVTGATTVYYTPHVHDGILLWDGTQWILVRFAEKSLALGTITSGKPYDVFGYLSGGDLALEMLVWTDDTTRATVVTYQDGRLCKSGDKTRLLLGTFYTTATTTTEDSAANRYLGNVYNRVLRPMANANETANSWTYGTASWRQANANTANQLNCMLAIPAAAIARVQGNINTSSAVLAGVGVGVDSTTAPSGTFGAATTAGQNATQSAQYAGMLAAGRHYLAWLEIGSATGTVTFYGDNNAPTQYQSGIRGEIWS